MQMPKQMKEWIMSGLVFLACWSIAWWAPKAQASEMSMEDFSTALEEEDPYQVEQAMAIDQNSGQVLFSKNAYEPHGIGSLTKLMSLYLIYDRLASGELTLDTKIPISSDISALSQAPDTSNVPLRESEDYYTVDQLIDATLMASANAAVVAMGEYIAGSEKGFVDLMNQKAEEMGLTSTHFYTASGLSGEYRIDAEEDGLTSDDENEMSARDVLVMTQSLINTYPDIITRASVPRKDFQVDDQTTFDMVNANKFLPGLEYGRNDVSGIKTGTEDKAGSCIVVRSMIDDHPILVATLGAENDQLRYQETGRLLDDLQSELVWTTIHPEGSQVMPDQTISVYDGQKPTTTLSYEKDTSLFLPVSYDQSVTEVAYETPLQYDAAGNVQVLAPLTKGQWINTEYDQTPFYETLSGNNRLEAPVVANEDVDRVNFFVHVSRKVAYLMENLNTWFKEMYGNFQTAIAK